MSTPNLKKIQPILESPATFWLLTSLRKSYIVVIKAPELRALIITGSGQLLVES